MGRRAAVCGVRVVCVLAGCQHHTTSGQRHESVATPYSRSGSGTRSTPLRLTSHELAQSSRTTHTHQHIHIPQRRAPRSAEGSKLRASTHARTPCTAHLPYRSRPRRRSVRSAPTEGLTRPRHPHARGHTLARTLAAPPPISECISHIARQRRVAGGSQMEDMLSRRTLRSSSGVSVAALAAARCFTFSTGTSSSAERAHPSRSSVFALRRPRPRDCK